MDSGDFIKPKKPAPPRDGGHLLFAIKSSVSEALSDSSIHGFPGMVRSKILLLKIGWLLLLLGSVGYCSYLIFLSAKSYLDYEVITNLYVEAEIPTKFPTVTICNDNSIMTEYGLNYTKSMLDSMGIDINDLSAFGSQYFDVLSARLMINTMALVEYQVDQDKIGLSLDDMLISCSYAGANCSSSDFVYRFNAWYGNCYQFNSGKYADGTTAPDLTVSKSGWYDGLVLELYVGSPTDPYSLSISSGLHVYVNNKTLYDGIFDGFAAQPGTNNLIGVSRTFSENLPAPYSECVSDDDIEKSDSVLVKAILSTGYKYRFSDCALMCWVQYSIDKCHCQDSSGITLFENITACITRNQTVCITIEYINFFQQDVKKLCQDRCPVECSSMEYEVKVTSLNYPSPSYYKYLLRQPYFQDRNLTSMSYDQIRSSILAININYDRMSYTRIEKSPKMELLDLISSIGGTLGLFCGASFMSFFELVDLGIVITYLVCQNLLIRPNAKRRMIDTDKSNNNSSASSYENDNQTKVNI